MIDYKRFFNIDLQIIKQTRILEIIIRAIVIGSGTTSRDSNTFFGFVVGFNDSALNQSAK